jgi:hypothetical protein
MIQMIVSKYLTLRSQVVMATSHFVFSSPFPPRNNFYLISDHISGSLSGNIVPLSEQGCTLRILVAGHESEGLREKSLLFVSKGVVLIRLRVEIEAEAKPCL